MFKQQKGRAVRAVGEVLGLDQPLTFDIRNEA